MTGGRPGATLSGLREFASAEGVEIHELHAGDGTAVVVPAWGGRIMFMGTGEANRLWTHPTLKPEGAWSFNKGGARSWYSPEGGDKGIYFSRDWSEWRCPAQMDPGSYVVAPDAAEDLISMANDFDATTNDGTQYALSMWREIESAERPGISAGVRCLPLRFSHSLRNLSERVIEKEIDLWHLVQVPAGGTIIVALNDGPQQAWRNYFDPIPAERMAEGGAGLCVKIDGELRYKLGVSAERAAGAMGYFLPQGHEASALVKLFDVEADATYADRPEADQQSNGDPVQLYNHFTGGAQAFGEIECHSPAATLAHGHVYTFVIDLLLLEGPRDTVLHDTCALMGVEVGDVEVF